MEIRKAQPGDLDRLMEIYRAAKDFMDRSGNPTQWKKGYPTREMIAADIEKGQGYVCVENGIVHAAFALVPGEDPFYGVIEDGQWKNDRPYGAIHRVASDGVIRRVFDEMFCFCRAQIEDLRADTHQDNRVMQQALERCGFVRCGIIYVANGTPRIAYQYVP
ncbi:MAG: N-acetyltransferase [Lachnospiraceae bacterium]|nr:N-acetyltransferase [Lachnospiraceae bacterium]